MCGFRLVDPQILGLHKSFHCLDMNLRRVGKEPFYCALILLIFSHCHTNLVFKMCVTCGLLRLLNLCQVSFCDGRALKESFKCAQGSGKKFNFQQNIDNFVITFAICATGSRSVFATNEQIVSINIQSSILYIVVAYDVIEYSFVAVWVIRITGDLVRPIVRGRLILQMQKMGLSTYTQIRLWSTV